MRWLTRLLLLSLLLIPVSVSAQVIRYVDTASPAGGNGTTSGIGGADPNRAYNLLSVWEAAEDTDLNASGVSHIVYCNRGPTGGVEIVGAGISINGWTTGTTTFICITSESGVSRHNGVWDNNKYILHNNDGATAILLIDEDYVRIDGLQFLVTQTGANSRNGIYAQTINVGGDQRYSNLILRGVCSGAGQGRGLTLHSANAIYTIWNVLAYDFTGDLADVSFAGIQVQGCVTAFVTNVTVTNCYNGIVRGAGGVSVYNSVVYNNVDDFVGSIARIAYCASDDNDSNPAGTNVAESAPWSANFVDSGASNFNLAAASGLVGTGVDNPGTLQGVTDIDLSADIAGNARSSTWDVGAFEYVASGGAAPAKRKPTKVMIMSWLDRLLEWLTPKAFAWRRE